MIYELDIKLTGGMYYVPGVKRKFRVGGSITLDELAGLILDSVSFSRDHLYDFYINGTYYDLEQSPFRHSKKTNVKLYSTGIKKGDRFIFSFDYGDDWEFEIKVTKAVDESGNIDPQLLKSEGTVEQYPDWEDWDEDDYEDEFEPFDDDFYPEHEDLFDNASIDAWEKLYTLGEAFKKQKPWLFMANDDEVEIVLPSGEAGYFCVMGNGGLEFGFSLYLGAEGHRGYQIMQSHEMDGISDDHVMAFQDSINMWLDDKEAIPAEQELILNMLDKHYRGSKNWIYFDRFESGYMPFILNKDEVETCTKFLEKLLEVLPDIKKTLKSVDGNYNEFTDFLSYSFTENSWQKAIKNYDEDEDIYAPKIVSLNPELSQIKKKKKNGQTWELDITKTFFVIDDEEYPKPIMPYLAVFVNSADGCIITAELFEPGDNTVDILNNKLIDAINTSGKPSELIVPDRLIAGLIESTCKSVGVKLIIGDVPNAIAAMEAYFEDNEGTSDFDIGFMQEFLEAFGIDENEAMKKAAGSKDDFLSFMEEQMFKGVDRNPDKVMKLIEKYPVPGQLDSRYDFDDPWDGVFDDDIPEFHEIKLKTIEDKVQQVKNVFGKGEYDEEMLENFEPMIVVELEKNQKKYFESLPQDVLYNLASAIGLLVDKGYKKELLLNMVEESVRKKPRVLLDALSKDEKSILKELFRMERDFEGIYVEEFDFPCETIVGLVNKGLLGVECYQNEDLGMHLELRPFDVMKNMIR